MLDMRNVLHFIADIIIRFRFVLLALFVCAAVYAGFSLGRVKTTSDMSIFLPSYTETRRGMTVMENEFTTYGSATIMVKHVSAEEAAAIANDLQSVEHVAGVVFDAASERYYHNSSARFSLSFDTPANDPVTVSALEEVKSLLSSREIYVSSEIGADFSKKIAGEMGLVLTLAFAVIILVLLFTSRSYLELPIYALVFFMAGLLNMGTNYWFGTISSITNSVAVILQLALAIDYAIIFMHRYQGKAAIIEDPKEAAKAALGESIAEIFSSSLTTVAGLLALLFMQFRLGYDLGIVLAKGIFASMLTVFFFMPGLVLLIPKALQKTRHRSFVPKIDGWGRILTKKVPVFLIVFALILPASIILSGKTEYSFSTETVTELVPSAERTAIREINDTFGEENPVAILVPGHDYEKEKEFLSEAESLPGVTGTTGLANISVTDNLSLTDPLSPSAFAAVSGGKAEDVTLLFQGYALEHGALSALQDIAHYEVPLADLVIYLFEKVDSGFYTPDEATLAQMNALRAPLSLATGQLRGENYDRLVLFTSLPTEGAESEAFLDALREKLDQTYPEGGTIIAGTMANARDLKDFYKVDAVIVSLLSILFVFLILFFTFRSPVAAAILVFVIQGSIWINFSIPYLLGMRASFVTNIIVSAIEMGATIDYAIVIFSRYKTLRDTLPKKEAVIRAVSDSFPTVLTSGAIMAVAGFLIGFLVTDVYIGHIGFAVGRGAVISMVLVLSVLPQFLLIFDKVIEKTTIRGRKKAAIPESREQSK